MPTASPADLRAASRVLCYGVTGSGKSTAATEIGAKLGLPVHLVDDEIGWLPGWINRPVGRQIELATQIVAAERWILDSTPLVGPDVEYCRKIGFTDSRSYCPVRPEGHPQRAACELYATGRAKDTGRAGPTWYRDGKFCTGRPSGCENNGDNQYLLDVYLGGTYQACASNGVCGEVVADP